MDESNGGKGIRNKRLNSEEKTKDRISDLPDSILQHILSFLPSTKQAIQTGILSKRWRNQWTCVPVLIFDSSGMYSDYSVEDFARSIDSTLLQHDCSKIKKFHLAYNFKKDSNFSFKIRFATEKKVEELILNCYFPAYVLPEFLFHNAFLVKLEIINCYFTYYYSINWESLKGFKMKVSWINKWAVANVLHGCPSLESLEINNHGGGYYGAIASKSLKVLVLVDVDIMDVTKIAISCPNLEQLSVKASNGYVPYARFPANVIEIVVSSCLSLCSLELNCCLFGRKLVIASESLKKLVLRKLIPSSEIEISCPNLEELKSESLHYETFKLMNVPSQYGGYCNEVKVKHIFELLQSVDELTIGSWFIKTLSDVEIMRGLSYPWYHNKILTLDCPDFEHLPGIICALRSSPTLEKLVINLQGGVTSSYVSGEKYSWNSNGNTVNCLMSHLETVQIIGLSRQDAECMSMLNFIKYLLEYARVLKKFVLMTSKDGELDYAFKVYQEVLSFPRCSQHAIIEMYVQIAMPNMLNWILRL